MLVFFTRDSRRSWIGYYTAGHSSQRPLIPWNTLSRMSSTQGGGGRIFFNLWLMFVEGEPKATSPCPQTSGESGIFFCDIITSTIATIGPLTSQLISRGGRWPIFFKIYLLWYILPETLVWTYVSLPSDHEPLNEQEIAWAGGLLHAVTHSRCKSGVRWPR